MNWADEPVALWSGHVRAKLLASQSPLDAADQTHSREPLLTKIVDCTEESVNSGKQISDPVGCMLGKSFTAVEMKCILRNILLQLLICNDKIYTVEKYVFRKLSKVSTRFLQSA